LVTNRVAVAQALSHLQHAVVPQTRRLPRTELEASNPGEPFPIVVRPVGSQAGKDLARVDDAAQLHAYLAQTAAHEFYVMPFIDFSRDDGYYRKYRIIIVDGVPYAYHLAISPRWMIHYYNAPMAENAWMREEEARFLSDFDAVFGPELQEALRRIARTLELEYVGVDCSIDRSGRLVVFEADPAMIVHAGDDPALFGYKIPAAKRVFAAFERLVDRVGSI
jgi:glutathione synthase/RimK-type ligase-like ATP-grasp enzyme